MGFFDFLLKPFRRPAAPAPVEELPPADRRRKRRKVVPPGMTVLIVDDSKTVVAVLRKMLRENNFTTLEAYDAESALEILRKTKPDLIFLDIVLPKMSGFDALRRIRRSTYVGRTPVIMISGNEAATEEYYVKRIGADDFMKKPFSRAEVFSRVERLLNLAPTIMQMPANASSDDE
jgi:twitching motility two-component system response regulator PilH